MTTSNKRSIYNRYLSGCEFMGIAPEFEYEERTAKQIAHATEALRTRYRKLKGQQVVDSVTKNTASAAKFIKQSVGEPLSKARERAKALAKLTGKAIPFHIVRNK